MSRTLSPASLRQPAPTARVRFPGLALALVVVAAWLAAGTHPAAAGQPGPAHTAAAGSSQPAQDAPPQQHAGGPAVQEAAHAAPVQGGHAAPEVEAHQAEGEHAEGHEESPWGIIGRLFNFLLLAGGLVYLLKSPFAEHLRTRAGRIKSDLVTAREMRAEASAQMAAIEERLKALPSEIELLKQRGTAEAAAEQVRMREAMEAERQRMLDQARREVESQVRTAERMLLKRAGELAVDVATERVRRTITDTDQARLVDRYLAQVGH